MINKAGILPYFRDERGLHIYVMKPVATHPELGAPPFQIAKGTRMMQVDGAWVDMKKDSDLTGETETLQQTAIREGIEEIGLIESNIAEIIDLGLVEFSSASKGSTKQMQLFAARISDPKNFLLDAEVASTTAERKWLSWPADKALVRADHAGIIAHALPLIP